MKHISLLVPTGAHIGCIDGTLQVFTEVNDFLISKGKQPAFRVQLVGVSKEPPLKNRLISISPDVLISEIRKTDLIIIPAPFYISLEKTIDLNKEFLPWIAKQYKLGSELASLCVGTFLLAATGLLKGRKCSTHWMFANDFRAMFPDVELVTDRIITDENGIYSSGGALSYMNLILYLVEKYAGREASVHCSKVFEVEIDRGSQSPFIMFRGQKSHEDEPIKKAQEYIEKHFQDKITVDQLASLLSIGRRNLERRFKKATSNTVVEYMQRVKIEAAKLSFESTRENVNEVMYKVGYTDTKAFRTTFKKITGLSPVHYRNKYNRSIAVYV
jgi:transcriptional regulator GlxA family with amidase domain